MEMPDFNNDINICGHIPDGAKILVNGTEYHADRILKAKDAEIESLHLEIDECHKALKRWAYSHDELRLEVELRKEIDELKDKLYKAMQGTQGAKK
jgi:uncharacterized protein YdcH (DUF465 family)